MVKSADCAGQANTFSYLADSFDLDVELAGYVTSNGSSHRIAIIAESSDNPKVFDPSLCQSYKKLHGDLPSHIRFIDMDEYIKNRLLILKRHWNKIVFVIIDLCLLN